MSPFRIRRISLSKQYEAYEGPILDAIKNVLGSGVYMLGPQVNAFEKEFSSYLGASECISVADGTKAISLVLSALGVGPGDEVITTPFTAIPTIGAIIDAGATPVFVDIDPDTWLLSLEGIEAKLSDRTKAIVPVHMFGNVVDIPAVKEMISEDVIVLEDAAQAHGSELRGHKAGTMGDAGTFSFYPSKNLGGYGDGGAIVTSDKNLADRLRLLRNHGMVDKDTCLYSGVNSRLDEIQAAILRVKLRHLDEMNQSRQALVDLYKQGLSEERFIFQKVPEGVISNQHILQVKYTGDRDALLHHMEDQGIQCNVYYTLPHHLQPAFKYLGYKEGDLPEVERLCHKVIALPLYPELSPQEVSDVIDACNGFCQKDLPG